MKYTIERGQEYRCYVIRDEQGDYLPNTYECIDECLEAILEHNGIEVEYDLRD